MTEKILAVLAGFIIAVISATGYVGIALLMAIESACIPLPSEIIMPFSGYLVLQRQVPAGVGGDGRGYRLQSRVGGALSGWRPWRPSAGGALWQVCSAEPSRPGLHHGFFLKYGFHHASWACWLLVVRTFIALPAGIARMPLWRFLSTPSGARGHGVSRWPMWA